MLVESHVLRPSMTAIRALLRTKGRERLYLQRDTRSPLGDRWSRSPAQLVLTADSGAQVEPNAVRKLLGSGSGSTQPHVQYDLLTNLVAAGASVSDGVPDGRSCESDRQTRPA